MKISEGLPKDKLSEFYFFMQVKKQRVLGIKS
jgi:hypothetical protein